MPRDMVFLYKNKIVQVNENVLAVGWAEEFGVYYCRLEIINLAERHKMKSYGKY